MAASDTTRPDPVNRTLPGISGGMGGIVSADAGKLAYFRRGTLAQGETLVLSEIAAIEGHDGLSPANQGREGSEVRAFQSLRCMVYSAGATLAVQLEVTVNGDDWRNLVSELVDTTTVLKSYGIGGCSRIRVKLVNNLAGALAYEFVGVLMPGAEGTKLKTTIAPLPCALQTTETTCYTCPAGKQFKGKIIFANATAGAEVLNSFMYTGAGPGGDSNRLFAEGVALAAGGTLEVDVELSAGYKVSGTAAANNGIVARPVGQEEPV